MKIDLDKTGMVHLVSGATPMGDIKEDLEKRNIGYTDEETGEWTWDAYALRRFDMRQLYDLYKQIRY